MFPPPRCAFGVSCRGWLLAALFVCSCFCIVDPRSWAGFPSWSVPFGVSCRCLRCYISERRSSWACIGNPKPEQETIKGTHAQETPAYQRRPTTLHAAQGRKQSPKLGAIHAASEDTTHTHIKPHRVPPVQQAQTSTAPTAGATGTIPAHTQLKMRRRGNSPAPENTSRHKEALAREAWPGLKTEYRLGDAKARSSSHTRARTVPPQQVPGPAAGSTPWRAPP